MEMWTEIAGSSFVGSTSSRVIDSIATFINSTKFKRIFTPEEKSIFGIPSKQEIVDD